MKKTYSIVYEFTEGRGKERDNEAVVTFTDLTLDELKQNLTTRKGDLNMNTVIRIVQEPTMHVEDFRSFIIEQISKMNPYYLIEVASKYPTLASCFRVDVSDDREKITRIMPYNPDENSSVYDHRTGWENS
jgi:hypothetical protein